MSLANQMERSREEQRHKGTDQVIPPAIWKKHRVFRFVNNGIDRIHQNAENQRQTPCARLHRLANACGRKAAEANRQKLSDYNCTIEFCREFSLYPRQLAARLKDLELGSPQAGIWRRVRRMTQIQKSGRGSKKRV